MFFCFQIVVQVKANDSYVCIHVIDASRPVYNETRCNRQENRVIVVHYFGRVSISSSEYRESSTIM